MSALLSLAAALPQLQVSTAASFDAPLRLAQSAGAPDALQGARGVQVDFRVWLEWDLARLLADPPGQGLSVVRRAAARRRIEVALARAEMAERARDANERLAAATSVLDAANAILDAEQAAASRPGRP